jgi:hypothetical protein
MHAKFQACRISKQRDATEANFELHTAWCLTTKSRFNEARKRLGLESEARSEAIALQI